MVTMKYEGVPLLCNLPLHRRKHKARILIFIFPEWKILFYILTKPPPPKNKLLFDAISINYCTSTICIHAYTHI